MYYVINNKKTNDILLKLSIGNFKINTHPYPTVIIDASAVKDFTITPIIEDDGDDTIISQSLLRGFVHKNSSEKINITLPENKIVRMTIVSANIKLEGRFAKITSNSILGRVQLNADKIMVMSESAVSTTLGRLTLHTSDAKIFASDRKIVMINNQKLNLSNLGGKVRRVRTHHEEVKDGA